MADIADTINSVFGSKAAIPDTAFSMRDVATVLSVSHATAKLYVYKAVEEGKLMLVGKASTKGNTKYFLPTDQNTIYTDTARAITDIFRGDSKLPANAFSTIDIADTLKVSYPTAVNHVAKALKEGKIKLVGHGGVHGTLRYYVPVEDK